MSAQPPLADNRHYTATAKWLHWSMAVLWLAAWILGVLAVYWRDALNPHHGLTWWHKALASALPGRSPESKKPALRAGSVAMELAGLEPATSWVRSRRSPN